MTTTVSGPFGSGAPAPDATPGTMPAWAVVFAEDATTPRALLTVSGDTYAGSLSASLPADLTGGRYEVVVEGLTDEDYQRIRLPAGRRLNAAIHLWWKDSGSGILADLSRAAGLGDLLGGAAQDPPAGSLVASIRVDTLRRQAGERRYDTVVSGRELVIARLGETVVRGGLCYVSLDAAARGIAHDAGVPVVTHGLTQLGPAPDEGHFADVRPGSALDAMRTVTAQATASLKRQGLSAAVVRDGVLHVGLWTARDPATAPLPVTRDLDTSGGLLAVMRGSDADPPSASAGSPPTRSRATVTATTLGRPDLKPGDTVRIPLPPVDFPSLAPAGSGIPLVNELADLFGSGADSVPRSPCIVTGVTHRLSARAGFVTVVKASVLRTPEDDGWDAVPPVRAESQASPDAVRGSVPADRASGAAGAVRGVARAVARSSKALGLLVGQVRGHPPAQAADGPAAQTSSDVWYSTAPADGSPTAVRRLQVTPEQHGELRQVPVLTPFAFGGYGLVLPRYPGGRVLLADTGGGGDVVDLGSVWDDGVGPPAEPGDWWLVLPVSAPTEDLAAEQAASPPSSGDASHDLIDADGRRVVEVSGLTLRVVDVPSSCATRPDPGETGVVVLENTKDGASARIVLRNDGSIAITGSGITLDAGTGDITLKAADVKVSVTGTMDVS